MDSLSLASTNTQQLTERYIALVEKMSQLLAIEQIEVLPYQNIQSLNFLQLTDELKQSQFDHFEKYVQVCEETIEQGHSLKESGFLLWNMLKKLELRSDSDIYTTLTENQILEIYDASNIQIFRNLNFFKVCSYSLDELLSIPWWKLFRRDDTVSREIFANGSKVFSGEATEKIEVQIPMHLLEEMESKSMLKVMVKIKSFVPLRGLSGELKCLVVEEAQLLSN